MNLNLSPSKKILLIDYLFIALLALLAIWLFRSHFIGDGLWIGNPDRLNGNLKFLKHYINTLHSGQISAWDDFEMMGYDSLAMVGVFPNPSVYLLALLGADKAYIAIGYFDIGLLALSGISAYFFLRTYFPAGIPAFIGALCYEFSSLTLLKVSQNSMSFAVFVMIPLLALAIRKIKQKSALPNFLILTILIGCMLHLMFLQKAAYAILLIFTYAAWCSYRQRKWLIFVIFSLALLAGISFAAPRILGIALAMREYSRAIDGLNLKDFETLYQFQGIFPSEIFRWFDYGIFGRTMSERSALGNSMNLTEGFLIFTSPIIPLLLAIGLIRNPREWLLLNKQSNSDTPFFFWVFIACISVLIFKPAAHAIFLLFMRMDFTHARILIAGLLPLSFLIAISLEDLSKKTDYLNKKYTFLFSVVFGLFIAILINVIASQFGGIYTLKNFPVMRQESLCRIALSLITFVVFIVIYGLRIKNFNSQNIVYASICGLIIGQCLIGANAQINDSYVWNFKKPFNSGDFYYAKSSEFKLPNKEQLESLHERINPDRFRVALVCDKDIAGGFCAGHIPEFWELRTIDGYYGIGVPYRLRILPWGNGASLRTISFTDLATMPWDLLGFLNVRYVLIGDDGSYRNISRNNDQVTGIADPSSFKIIESPARVTPRVFFTKSAKPVISPNEAVKEIFQKNGVIDPEKVSFIEGINESKNFEDSGFISLTGGGDFIRLNFNKSASERLLILNDLYFPGWHADINGKEIPIFPANVVMRSVIIPPGVDEVNFRYTTYLKTKTADFIRICALILVILISFFLKKYSKKLGERNYTH